MQCHFYQVSLITHRNNIPLDHYLDFIKLCTQAGITSVQLREKNATPEFLFLFGEKIKKILSPFHIPLIINDHIDIALALNADGVHLGQTDGDPVVAREKLGADKIIGLSVNSYENIVLAGDLPINYVGIGPVFNTRNKVNTPALGIAALKSLSLQSKHPVVAIGGINEKNASLVVSAGASGVAVIDAIHVAHDPFTVINKLNSLLNA